MKVLLHISAPLMVTLVLLCGATQAYWQEECGGDPEGWLLPENHALDCKLRSLAIEYASKISAKHRHGLPAVAPRVREALNFSICASEEPTLVNSEPSARAVPSASEVAASLGAETQLYVAPSGSDTDGDGSAARPFQTLVKAQVAARAALAQGDGGVIVWLREGVHYQPAGALTLTATDSGKSKAQPMVYAGYPGENVTLSASATPLAGLKWAPVDAALRLLHGLAPNGPAIFRAKLPPTAPRRFVGLFANGRRLTRARYPNCADITGVDCYTLNASGPTSNPKAPSHDLQNDQGAFNLEVVNGHGVDMFADEWDNAPATGPHGASDGTLPPGLNKTLTVEHPDYAWRCHEDCGWQAYSKWRGIVCDGRLGSIDGPHVCRMDPTHNEPYWNQQVSGGFYFNASAKALPWAPAWTQRSWANASTGIVHMYHSARWGGWQFQLAARNDSDHSLLFACTLFDPAEDGITMIARKEAVPCPVGSQAPALVHGGWQEARGAQIGPQYTRPSLNNSYFVENIKEELDYAGEWYLDEADGYLYLVPPPGTASSVAALTELSLVPVHNPTAVRVNATSSHPVKHTVLANLTIMHTSATFMKPYETSSGGDWSIHRGASVFVQGALDFTVEGIHFDQIDGNGVFFSRFVRNSTIARNSFSAIGDSAILVVGASGRHRTNQAQSFEYPAYNLIEENHVDTNGVWVKQSAAYFKSVTRANVIRNNVFHDGPRSGINYNDGAMGGELMEGNLLLNYVKESNDHGPFNSWDRQPYVFRKDEYDTTTSQKLKISPDTQIIRNNLVYNINFHAQSCGSIAIDFDDESSQYNVTQNVLVYGGVKTFDGMDRQVWDNLVIYPGAAKSAGPACFHALQSTRNLSSLHTHFFENTCVLRPGDFPYNCGAGPAPFFNATDHVDVHANKFIFPNATFQQAHDWSGACQCWPNPEIAGSCPYKNFSQWQEAGHDVGSTIEMSLPDHALLDQAKGYLGL